MLTEDLVLPLKPRRRLEGRINVLIRSDCGRAPLYGIAQTMSVNILENTVHGMASRWHPWAVTGTCKSILESD